MIGKPRFVSGPKAPRGNPREKTVSTGCHEWKLSTPERHIASSHDGLLEIRIRQVAAPLLLHGLQRAGASGREPRSRAAPLAPPVPTVFVGHLYVPEQPRVGFQGMNHLANAMELTGLPLSRFGRAASAMMLSFLRASRFQGSALMTTSPLTAIRLSSGQIDVCDRRAVEAVDRRKTDERSPDTSQSKEEGPNHQKSIVLERQRTADSTEDDDDEIAGVVMSIPVYWGLKALQHFGRRTVPWRRLGMEHDSWGDGEATDQKRHGPSSSRPRAESSSSSVVLLSDVDNAVVKGRPESALRRLGATLFALCTRRWPPRHSHERYRAHQLVNSLEEIPVWTLPKLRLYQYTGQQQLVQFTPAMLSLRAARQMAEGSALLSLRRALQARMERREGWWRGLEERVARDWVGTPRSKEEGLEEPPEVDQLVEEIVSDLASDPNFVASLPWRRALQFGAGVVALGALSSVGACCRMLCRGADTTLALTPGGRRALGIEHVTTVVVERQLLTSLVNDCATFNRAQEDVMQRNELRARSDAEPDHHKCEAHQPSTTLAASDYRTNLTIAALSLAAMTPPVPQPLLEGVGALAGPLCLFQSGNRGSLSHEETAFVMDRLRQSELVQTYLLGRSSGDRSLELQEMLDKLESNAGPLLMEMGRAEQPESKAPGKGLETSVVGKGILLLGGGDQTPLSIAKSIAVEDLTHIFQTEGTEPNLTSDQKPKG